MIEDRKRRAGDDAPDELESGGEGELARILRWRAAALEEAGYGAAAALTLARHKDVDVHLAADLLDRGCPQALALRILL